MTWKRIKVGKKLRVHYFRSLDGFNLSLCNKFRYAGEIVNANDPLKPLSAEAMAIQGMCQECVGIYTTMVYESRRKPKKTHNAVPLKKNRLKGKPCTKTEHAYRSREYAASILVKIQKSRGDKDSTGRVYYCWSCHAWHLTSKIS